MFKSNPKLIGTLEDGLTLQFGTNRSDTELVIYGKQLGQFLVKVQK